MSLETLRLQNLLMGPCVAWEMLLSQLHIQEVSSSVKCPLWLLLKECNVAYILSLPPNPQG